MQIGIVTGASSGLGREFARQLAGTYALDEIWLIARRADRLEATARTIVPGKGVIIPMDLNDPAAMQDFETRLREAAPRIRVLVNSAGYALDAPLAEAPLERLMDMIDLNVKALVRLTRACLPYMEKGGVILQVASINAFLPVARGAVYAGTKAFVRLFSLSLAMELKGQGIHVMTVSPGPVNTEFAAVATGRQAAPAGADPAAVVKQALSDAAAGRLNSTYGFATRINIFLARVLRTRTLIRLLGG